MLSLACGDETEEAVVLDAFVDALCDCGAGRSWDEAGAEIKRAFNVFVLHRLLGVMIEQRQSKTAEQLCRACDKLRDQEEGCDRVVKVGPRKPT